MWSWGGQAVPDQALYISPHPKVRTFLHLSFHKGSESRVQAIDGEGLKPQMWKTRFPKKPETYADCFTNARQQHGYVFDPTEGLAREFLAQLIADPEQDVNNLIDDVVNSLQDPAEVGYYLSSGAWQPRNNSGYKVHSGSSTRSFVFWPLLLKSPTTCRYAMTCATKFSIGLVRCERV
ncbi:hypothetical protein K3495_g7386 [Podosphaera aphanis]|nr:hypothetical protein K3495_g7386 [Podosphaera aphanis]